MVGPGDLRYSSHHRDWSYGKHIINFFPRVYQLLKFLGNKAVKAIRTVISGNVCFITHSFHFVFKDHKLF